MGKIIFNWALEALFCGQNCSQAASNCPIEGYAYVVML